MIKIKFPIAMQYKKFECYFRVYQPDSDGNINITFRMNTVNDTRTYRWIYGNVKDYEANGPDVFFKALVEFHDELQHLKYAWEGQPPCYANGKYIKGSVLYAIPVFDGNQNIKQIAEDEPFPAMRYVKLLH